MSPASFQQASAVWSLCGPCSSTAYSPQRATASSHKGSALKGSYAKVMASWVSPPSAVKFEECFGLGLEAVHFPGFAQLSSHLVPLCTGVVATQADVKERVVVSPASPLL